MTCVFFDFAKFEFNTKNTTVISVVIPIEG